LVDIFWVFVGPDHDQALADKPGFHLQPPSSLQLEAEFGSAYVGLSSETSGEASAKETHLQFGKAKSPTPSILPVSANCGAWNDQGRTQKAVPRCLIGGF